MGATRSRKGRRFPVCKKNGFGYNAYIPGKGARSTVKRCADGNAYEA